MNEHNWEDICIQLRNQQTCTSITKSSEVRFSIRVLQMSHHKFANGTRVLLCISNWLQNGFFTTHGLHYNQDFSDGQIQHDNTFC